MSLPILLSVFAVTRHKHTICVFDWKEINQSRRTLCRSHRACLHGVGGFNCPHNPQPRR